MFDPINLDALTIDPAELRDVANTLYVLSTYANRKADAMECRAKGHIAQAIDHERVCERLYSKLPQWARW